MTAIDCLVRLTVGAVALGLLAATPISASTLGERLGPYPGSDPPRYPDLFIGDDDVALLDPYPGTPPYKLADRPFVAPGGTIIWTITIANDAFDDDALLVLSDDVPDPADGLPVAAWTLAADLISIPPGSRAIYDGDALSVDRIVVPGRNSVEIVFRTVVNAGAPDGTLICNGAVLRYEIETCTGMLCTSKTYRSISQPGPGTTPGYTCIEVRQPSASADLYPLRSTYTDDCVDPTLIDGSIAPGETVSLDLVIQNVGGTDATATTPPITGTLLAGVGYTILNGTSAYTTTVSPNVLLRLSANEGLNTTPFRIRVDPAVACPSVLTLNLEVSRVTGGPFTVNYDLPVGTAGCVPKCLDVALSPGRESMRDSCPFTPPGRNARIDPGDDVYVTLPVNNAGPDNLNGVPTITGTLTTASPGVTILFGFDTSDFPNIPVGGSASSVREFAFHVADTLPCGSPIDLRLELDSTEAGPRVVNFPLAVTAACVACAEARCTATAVAAASGPTTYCEGGSVTVTAAGSTVPGCTGSAVYQWFEDGVAIAAATLPTYDVPTTKLARTYNYSVAVTCSSEPTCTDRSPDIPVVIVSLPAVIRQVKGHQVSGLDVWFTWLTEPSASGGYRLYRTDDKLLIPASRCSPVCTPGVVEIATTTADPLANQATDVGAVPGPARELFHYQVLALCADQATEGPN